MASLRTIWNNHFNLPSLPPPGTFKDQTIIITGASGGLGLATAVHFVNLGASTVIITTRSASKGAAAKAAIEAQTHTQGKDIVRALELDMGTFAGTKAFAEKIKAEVSSVDYVLLNAGVLNTEFVQSEEGWEEDIQVNALSTALLALLLLPWVKTAGKGKAHLGFVTSGLHKTIKIGEGFPKEDVLGFFNQKENWEKWGAQPMYGVSKLFEQYVVREIAKLALGPNGSPQVIVNPMCPGMVKSDLGRQFRKGFVMSLMVDIFMSTVAKPTEGGARSLVLAALTLPAENGKYITHYQSDEDYQRIIVNNVTGPEGRKMQAQVWKEVLAVLEEKVPEVKEIVHPTSTVISTAKL